MNSWQERFEKEFDTEITRTTGEPITHFVNVPPGKTVTMAYTDALLDFISTEFAVLKAGLLARVEGIPKMPVNIPNVSVLDYPGPWTTAIKNEGFNDGLAAAITAIKEG